MGLGRASAVAECSAAPTASGIPYCHWRSWSVGTRAVAGDEVAGERDRRAVDVGQEADGALGVARRRDDLERPAGPVDALVVGERRERPGCDVARVNPRLEAS